MNIFTKYFTNKKYVVGYILSAVLLSAVLILGICTGAVSFSLRDIAEGIKGNNHVAEIIIKEIRLPRVAGAFLAGFALAVAGAALQWVTGNELCAPNIIGVNSGAGLGVMIILCLAPDMWYLLPVGAFAGAAAATGLVMGIAICIRGADKSSIVLSGVAVSSVLSAGISFLSLRYPDNLSGYNAFSVGGFEGVELKDIIIPLWIVLAATFVLQIMAAKLNVLCLGEQGAASLGINVKMIRITALATAAALAGAAVSFAGLLGFVGLIVPNAIRRIFGNDMRYGISLSGIYGGILAVLSDWAGRTLFAPAQLPAGMIMALIGAPFFLYLLIKGGRRYDRG